MSFALFVAARSNWTVGYLACIPLAFSGPIASLFMGEPKRHHEPKAVKGARALLDGRVGVRLRPVDAREDDEVAGLGAVFFDTLQHPRTVFRQLQKDDRISVRYVLERAHRVPAA